ncbi:MAG: hypothetical protein ACFFET_18335 [Candidatus Thorarchaeota archaeon]
MDEIAERINRAITSQDPPQVKGLKLYELGYLAARFGDFQNAEIAFESLIIPPFPGWPSSDHKLLAWQVDSHFWPRPIFCPDDSVSWTDVDGWERNVEVHDVVIEDWDVLPEKTVFEQDEDGNIIGLKIHELGEFNEKYKIRPGPILRFPYLESIEFSRHQMSMIAPRLRRLEIHHLDSWDRGNFDSIFAPMLSKLTVYCESESVDFDDLMKFPVLEEFDLALIWGKEMNYDWSGFVTRYGLKKFNILFGHADYILPVYSADYILRYVDWVEEIEPYRELISNWKFDIASYRWILEGHPLSKLLFEYIKPRTVPWSHCWSLYNYYLQMIPEQTWLLNKAILYGLNLEEFMGYAGSLSMIIDGLPDRYQPIELPLMCRLNWKYRENEESFEFKKKRKGLLKEYGSTRDHFRMSLLEKSLVQIQDGGTTLLFDIERIGKDKLGTELAAKLVERRREEIENTTLLRKEDTIDLSPLWCTHHGFRILRFLGLRLSCNQSEFAQVEKQLGDLGLAIEHTSKEDDVTYGCVVPESIRRIILSRLTPTNWETVEHRLSRLADFRVYPVNPTLFSSGIVVDWRESNPYEFEKWRKIRDAAAEKVEVFYPRDGEEGFGIGMPEHSRN